MSVDVQYRGSTERCLRLPLHDPVDAGVADFQFGGNGPSGHSASRHFQQVAAINDKALASKVVRAVL